MVRKFWNYKDWPWWLHLIAFIAMASWAVFYSVISEPRAPWWAIGIAGAGATEYLRLLILDWWKQGFA